MNLNVLNDYPYTAYYYLTHPWKIFTHTWYNIKAAWERITKGHAWVDSAEMDNFLLHIIPSMLKDIANGNAYPGTEEFPTYESWEKWCYDLINKFELLQDEKYQERNNEYEEEYNYLLTHHNSEHSYNITMTHPYDISEEHYKEISKKYFKRFYELSEERNRLIKEAFQELTRYYTSLWI